MELGASSFTASINAAAVADVWKFMRPFLIRNFSLIDKMRDKLFQFQQLVI